MHLRKSFVALAAAISVALMSTGAVFAAGASDSVTQTVTVESYTTLTVDPASVSFGTTLADNTVYADSDLDISWATNNADGISVDVAVTDFVSGTNVIDKTNEGLDVGDGAGYVQADGYNLASSSGPTEGSATAALRLNIPFDAVSGTYSSTLTVSATEN